MGTSVLCSATITSDLTLLTKQGLPQSPWHWSRIYVLHNQTVHISLFLQRVLPSYTLPSFLSLSLSFNNLHTSYCTSGIISESSLIQIDMVHAGVSQMN